MHFLLVKDILPQFFEWHPKGFGETLGPFPRRISVLTVATRVYPGVNSIQRESGHFRRHI